MAERVLNSAEWNTLFNMTVGNRVNRVIPDAIATELERRGYVERVGATYALTLRGREIVSIRLASRS